MIANFRFFQGMPAQLKEVPRAANIICVAALTLLNLCLVRVVKA